MSVEALTWVLNGCPDLPAHCLGVMVGLANHAGADGKGAYPSQPLLAWYARKSDRAVRTDLDTLAEAGLIRLGDQRMVAHLPADRRPVVWDLAIERTRDPRPEPGYRGRPAAEKRAEPQDPPPPENGRKPTSTRDETAGQKRAEAGFRAEVEGENGWKPTSTEPSLEPSLNPSPPTPQDQPPSVVADTATGEGEDTRPEPGTAPSPATIDALVDQILELRPEWRGATIRAALRDPRVGERHIRCGWPVVAAAARIIAADPTTTSPGRLTQDGPWWTQATREAGTRRPQISTTPRAPVFIAGPALDTVTLTPHPWREIRHTPRRLIGACGHPDCGRPASDPIHTSTERSGSGDNP